MGLVKCQYCESRIDFNKEPEFGEHILCQYCQAEYMVFWLNPIELSSIHGDKYDDDSYLDSFVKIKRKRRIS
jgi:hypothetical protein